MRAQVHLDVAQTLDGEAWGRPVDVLVMADGSLLVSDDKAGAICRVGVSAVK